MIISELKQNIKQQLETNDNIESPQLECDMLLMQVLKIDRMALYLNPTIEVSEEQQSKLQAMVERRLKNEPIQYIIGKREFMGLELEVTPDVLIPRQDTEILVEAIIQRVNQDKPCEILEWCTGSGCIAVAVAHHCKNVEVTAYDISDKAVNLAKRNADKCGVTGRVSVCQADLLKEIWQGQGSQYDFICSNPPYIETNTIPLLPENVKAFEPLLALDGGEDGLIFYRELINKSPYYLKDGGYLVLEIGYNQAKSVSELLRHEPFDTIEVIKDLAGFDRVIIARRKERSEGII